MIAHRDAVRDAVCEQRGGRVFQSIHGVGGMTPLRIVAGVVAILHAIAQLCYEHDVARCLIRNDPIGLRGEDARCATFETGNIMLRVGQRDDREVRSGWLSSWPS